ncbi:MAG: hypothetical protein V7739_01915 [Motiliproteus sp.]
MNNRLNHRPLKTGSAVSLDQLRAPNLVLSQLLACLPALSNPTGGCHGWIA